jgi:hypothetical protein
LAPSKTFKLTDILYKNEAGVTVKFDTWSEENALDNAQNEWARRFAALELGTGSAWTGLSGAEIALLHATMIDDYDPPEAATAWGRYGGRSFSLSACRQLEWSESVDTNVALFIGFSHAPGPATLHMGSRGHLERVPPTRALTMIRMLIPLS